MLAAALALGERRAARRSGRAAALLAAMEQRLFAERHGARLAGVLRRGAAGALRRTLHRLEPFGRGAAGEDTARRLVWAGVDLRAEQFAALRLFGLALGGVIGAAAAAALLAWPDTVPLGGLAALCGWYAPEAWLGSALARRRERIDRELLFFVDFLALVAEAGLGPEQALRRVSEEFPGLLSLAFAEAARERGVGQWNEWALRGVAERLGHRDVDDLVQALVRAERLGARTADVLRGIARRIRRQRAEAAREHANRAGSIIILPVVLFILPAILVVVAYPAAATVLGALGATR